MHARRPAVTLEDVARASGYSRATVSRVVNGQANVDPEIAEAVQRAVRSTGYAANLAARALAGGATHNIGLVFTESFQQLFQNPYWGEVVEGLSSTLTAHGYRETFLMRGERRQLDAVIAQRGIDAAVIMSPGSDDGLEGRLQRGAIPTVVFGQPRQPKRTSFAAVDEEATGALAARRIRELGRTAPVLITGRDDMQVSRRRCDGFCEAWHGSRIAASRIAPGDFTVTGGFRAMEQLLVRHRRIDAVFALSDRMALGALQALHAARRSVPTDVLVIGVDGTVLGEQAQPTLTSIGVDLQALGRELGALTLEAIAGEPSRSTVFSPTLVARASG